MKLSGTFTSDDLFFLLMTSLLFVYVCGDSRDRQQQRAKSLDTNIGGSTQEILPNSKKVTNTEAGEENVLNTFYDYNNLDEDIHLRSFDDEVTQNQNNVTAPPINSENNRQENMTTEDTSSTVVTNKNYSETTTTESFKERNPPIANTTSSSLNPPSNLQHRPTSQEAESGRSTQIINIFDRGHVIVHTDSPHSTPGQQGNDMFHTSENSVTSPSYTNNNNNNRDFDFPSGSPKRKSSRSRWKNRRGGPRRRSRHSRRNHLNRRMRKLYEKFYLRENNKHGRNRSSRHVNPSDTESKTQRHRGRNDPLQKSSELVDLQLTLPSEDLQSAKNSNSKATVIPNNRHLCSRWGREWKPVTQSYRRPVYRDGRTTYQTAYRTTFRMRSSRIQACCPGWKKKNPTDKYCLIPECKSPCEHGKCVAPDICMCDAGFSGHKCNIDLNECSGRHKCQQKCTNTYGSYDCGCHDGFTLNADKITCKLCLSCIEEFREVKQQVENLTMKIDHLEEEKRVLQNNLTSAVTQYNEAISAFKVQEVTHTRTAPPTTSTDGYGLYDDMPVNRLTSLSEQISMLEERMAQCQCNRNEQYEYDTYG